MLPRPRRLTSSPAASRRTPPLLPLAAPSSLPPPFLPPRTRPRLPPRRCGVGGQRMTTTPSSWSSPSTSWCPSRTPAPRSPRTSTSSRFTRTLRSRHGSRRFTRALRSRRRWTLLAWGAPTVNGANAPHTCSMKCVASSSAGIRPDGGGACACEGRGRALPLIFPYPSMQADGVLLARRMFGYGEIHRRQCHLDLIRSKN